MHISKIWRFVASISLALAMQAGSALAQIPAAGFDNLATAISSYFPLANTQAHAGNNWCFEIESDPNVNWWYMKFAGYNYAYQSEYAKRIRLIYKNNNTGAQGFASIFLSIDLGQAPDYGTIAPNIEALKLLKFDVPKPINITFPPASDAGCPDLKDVLPALFYKDTQPLSWRPLGNPLCDDSANASAATICKNPTGADQKPHWERQRSQDFGDVTKLLMWNFNGRTHLVPGALRFLIQICQKADCTDDRQAYGYLNIGFGGNGGAG